MEVFCTSPWVPPEWIKAHGLEPRGVWLSCDFAGQAVPLAAGVCAFANAAVRLAERESRAAVVFTTHCDQLRRGADAVAEAAPARVFLFNLPVTWQTPVAQRMFGDELQRLGRFLEALGGHAPEVEELLEVMAHYSRARRQLLAAAAWCPARAYAEAVGGFHLDGSVRLPPPPTPAGPEPAAAPIPLAMIGGPLPQSQMPLLDALERAGGRVVLNATEAGERSLWPGSTPEPAQRRDSERSVSPTLLAQLTRGWLAHCVDVFQRPNTPLYDWLRERLTARRARGIVLWHYVGCDLWRAEAQPLRDAFGLPVLLLEADDAALQRNTGRLDAFLESLR